MTAAAAQGVGRIWGDRRPLVGMIHLPPLPGSPRWGGAMTEVLDRALADARALAGAGFDAALVENFGDTPFFSERVPPETVAALTAAVASVVRSIDLPVGVNVLRNDARAALAIAAATGASFVRVNVHTGSMWTDQGLVEGRAAETVRLRASLCPEVAILADVHVKHAVPPSGYDLRASARDAWHRGLADALLVSGSGTGEATPIADVRAVADAVPEAPVFVGSGLTAVDAPDLLRAAHGAIVGSSVMRGGRAGGPIDAERARALVAAARRR